MSEHVGQDPDEVDRLAAELDGASAALGVLRQQVTGALAGTSWSGPDRDRFESDWTVAGSARLASAGEALAEASRSASASAALQRSASGVA